AAFPRQQILVLDQADLLERRAETLGRVFRHLEVDDRFTSERFEELHRTRDSRQRISSLGARLRHGRAANAVRRLGPGVRTRLFPRLRRLVSQRVEAPSVDPAVRERLRELYAPEADALREITGEEFPNWQV